jgi:hypothetical protein
MIEPGSEEEKHRRRRVAAYRHAADIHDEAAQAHEGAADLFDRLGKAALAERERRIAARERQNARADYGRAAALELEPPTGIEPMTYALRACLDRGRSYPFVTGSSTSGLVTWKTPHDPSRAYPATSDIGRQLPASGCGDDWMSRRLGTAPRDTACHESPRRRAHAVHVPDGRPCCTEDR